MPITIRHLIQLCLLLGLSTQCLAGEGIRHVVMVWMNDTISEAQIEEARTAAQVLATIPVVTAVNVGRAIASDRPIVDDSFDLGLVIDIRSEADLPTYLEHPVHKQFVDQYMKGKMDKIVIYDF